jgi:hypothetical protein
MPCPHLVDLRVNPYWSCSPQLNRTFFMKLSLGTQSQYSVLSALLCSSLFYITFSNFHSRLSAVWRLELCLNTSVPPIYFTIPNMQGALSKCLYLCEYEEVSKNLLVVTMLVCLLRSQYFWDLITTEISLKEATSYKPRRHRKSLSFLVKI